MARHGENIRKRSDGRWEARYQVLDPDKGRSYYRSVYGSTYDEVKKKRAGLILERAHRSVQETGSIRETGAAQGTGATQKAGAAQGAGKAQETGSGQEAGAIQEARSPQRMGAVQEGGVIRGAGPAPEGRDAPDMQIPFSQAASGWLEEISDKHKYSTYVKYENIYRIHLEGLLGAHLLSHAAGQEFQEKISDHLSGDNVSDSIRKSICCVANQILTFADRKYSVGVPVLKLEAKKSVKKPVETFAKSEQSRLLAHLNSSPDKTKIALLLCLYTGIRLGELCALKWTDLNMEDMTLTVNRTVQRITVKGYMTKTILMETTPKSGCSKRTIPLTAQIMELLKGLGRNQPYVFGGGRPLEPRTMQYRFKRILGKVGVDKKNFHILRHTFATNCVESGMDAKTLSVILGHAGVKITLDRYVHPTI